MKRCSFCSRSEDMIAKLFQGKQGTICDRCLAWAASSDAVIAACASCTPVDGKHADDCVDRDIA